MFSLPHHTTTATLQRIKPSSFANTMKGLVFSFYIDYSSKCGCD